MIPTFRPWTHTSDDSYIYQLSLVVATATVSYSYLMVAVGSLRSSAYFCIWLGAFLARRVFFSLAYFCLPTSKKNLLSAVKYGQSQLNSPALPSLAPDIDMITWLLFCGQW